MLRNLLCLSALTLGAAKVDGTCFLNSADAVSDALDASVYIWAAYKRCGNAGHNIQCEIDIASAVQSVNAMANVIMKVVNKCKPLQEHNQVCGMKIGKLTSALAELTASSGRIAQNCPGLKPLVIPTANTKLEYPLRCAVDLKDSAKGIFSAVKKFQSARKTCEAKGPDCTVDSLDVASAISDLGSFVAGSVGQCKRATAQPANSENAMCAQGAADALAQAIQVASDAMQIKKACAPPAPRAVPAPLIAHEQLIEVQVPQSRLYEKEGFMGMMGVSSSATNYFLGALLPLTAIVGFVGGRRYANRRATESRECLSDCE